MKTQILGVVMDPLDRINFKKDSTLSMLWEAMARDMIIYYFTPTDLVLQGDQAFGYARQLKVYKNKTPWFELSAPELVPLTTCAVILMRKDPPVDFNYLTATYILEYAERSGVLVVNKPQSLRDANEKLFSADFPEFCSPSVVSANLSLLQKFYETEREIILKPLNSMGGNSVFYLRFPDKNANVIMEQLTQRGQSPIIAQRFIPEIFAGDKRILLIDGKPIPYSLARIPAPGEFRGNLAAGATGIAKPLTERDYEICQAVGQKCVRKGLIFVGLDVIGDYLTEINVTSPTGIRELDEQCKLNISQILFDSIFAKL